MSVLGIQQEKHKDTVSKKIVVKKKNEIINRSTQNQLTYDNKNNYSKNNPPSSSAKCRKLKMK